MFSILIFVVASFSGCSSFEEDKMPKLFSTGSATTPSGIKFSIVNISIDVVDIIKGMPDDYISYRVNHNQTHIWLTWEMKHGTLKYIRLKVTNQTNALVFNETSYSQKGTISYFHNDPSQNYIASVEYDFDVKEPVHKIVVEMTNIRSTSVDFVIQNVALIQGGVRYDLAYNYHGWNTLYSEEKKKMAFMVSKKDLPEVSGKIYIILTVVKDGKFVKEEAVLPVET